MNLGFLRQNHPQNGYVACNAAAIAWRGNNGCAHALSLCSAYKMQRLTAIIVQKSSGYKYPISLKRHTVLLILKQSTIEVP
jgi:hypothetical protein